MGGAEENKCDASSAMVFIVGLVAGTGCIICSKTLFELKAVGISGVEETFEPQVFQPFVMFFGMLFALPMYLALEARKRIRARSDPALRAELDAAPPITVRHLLMLGVPSIFDLASVVLLVSGLMHVPASMWMLLRGGCIVFVALMKQYVLHDELKPHMWAGVIIIALAVCLVGASPMLDEKEEGEEEGGGSDDQFAFGLLLTIGGTFMQSLQYVYEEKMMSGDTKAPPWLLIGMEGFFGTLLSVLVVYPLAIYLPGSDHGSIESLENTLTMLGNNALVMQLSVIFCITVFILNSFSVLVTFMLSSVWHAILDNFRPITIWATQLAIFALSGGTHGEKWSRGSYLQLLGLAVMLYGTAVYNGSATLPGIEPAEDDLLAEGDKMASSALSRSPLMTNARLDVDGKSQRSPYAQPARLPIADPMTSRGGGDALKERLVGKK